MELKTLGYKNGHNFGEFVYAVCGEDMYFLVHRPAVTSIIDLKDIVSAICEAEEIDVTTWHESYRLFDIQTARTRSKMMEADTYVVYLIEPYEKDPESGMFTWKPVARLKSEVRNVFRDYLPESASPHDSG